MSNLKNFLRENKLFLLGLISISSIYILDKERGGQILVELWHMLYEIIPILILMFGLLAFLKIGLNSNVVERKINSGNSSRNTFLAYLIGMFISGPIYPGFNLGRILIEKGVRIRSIIILLSMWATLKVPFLPYELDLFGFKFTMIRWIVTGTTIYIIAILSEKIILSITKKNEYKKKDTLENLVVGMSVRI